MPCAIVSTVCYCVLLCTVVYYYCVLLCATVHVAVYHCDVLCAIACYCVLLCTVPINPSLGLIRPWSGHKEGMINYQALQAARSARSAAVNIVYVFLVSLLLRFWKSGGGRAGAQPPVTSRE